MNHNKRFVVVKMPKRTKSKFLEIFELEDYKLKILLNRDASLFWKVENGQVKHLSALPWEFQLPFYLKFLHNDNLSERFNNLEILGAIDVYIKSKFYNGEPLDI